MGSSILEHTRIRRVDFSTTQVQADLLSVHAQVTGFQAAYDPLPYGPEKNKMAGKRHRLNDRKENLEKRLGIAGNTGLLTMQMQRGLAEKQVSSLNTFIAGVETRKAALN